MSKEADIFDVYGRPPPNVTTRLSVAGEIALKRYIKGVASNVYKIAFDCGKHHAEREIKRKLESLIGS